LLCVCALPAQDSKTAKPKIVAVVQGTAITDEELSGAADHLLANWELQHLQAEANYTRGKQQILEGTLESLLENRILAAEAAKQGVTKEALLAKALEGKVKEPTPADVQVYYDSNKERLAKPLDEALSSQILQYLKVRNTNQARAEYLQPLKKQYGAVTLLQPLRMDVKTAGSPSQGPQGARVTLVEFSDFECPYCAGLAGTLRQVEAKYGKQVRLVYKNFPLIQTHPEAEKAAEASLCAADQNHFWEMHDALFQAEGQLKPEDLQAECRQGKGRYDGWRPRGRRRDARSLRQRDRRYRNRIVRSHHRAHRQGARGASGTGGSGKHRERCRVPSARSGKEVRSQLQKKSPQPCCSWRATGPARLWGRDLCPPVRAEVTPAARPCSMFWFCREKESDPFGLREPSGAHRWRPYRHLFDNCTT
jgi:protein-disulfide isomerase